jgi:hypothetical protein
MKFPYRARVRATTVTTPALPRNPIRSYGPAALSPAAGPVSTREITRSGGEAITMRRAFVVLWLLLPVVATADQPQRKSESGLRRPTTTTTRQGPDVFGGFSYTHAGQANLKGWQLSGAVPFGGRLLGGSLRIAADLSGHYGSFAGADLSQLTFLAGPRLAWRGHRLSPFAQVLAGGARTRTSINTPQVLSGSTTSWGGAFGAGADYRLTRRWAARAQADLLLLHGQGVWDTNPRLSLGAVYRFGH